jgi:hypothetical protein
LLIIIGLAWQKGPFLHDSDIANLANLDAQTLRRRRTRSMILAEIETQLGHTSRVCCALLPFTPGPGWSLLGRTLPDRPPVVGPPWGQACRRWRELQGIGSPLLGFPPPARNGCLPLLARAEDPGLEPGYAADRRSLACCVRALAARRGSDRSGYAAFAAESRTRVRSGPRSQMLRGALAARREGSTGSSKGSAGPWPLAGQSRRRRTPPAAP